MMATREADRKAGYEIIAEERLGEWAELLVERHGACYYIHRRLRITGERCQRARIYKAEAIAARDGDLGELFDLAVERGWGFSEYRMA